MLGVIWFVQVVHYPLFAGVGQVNFPIYEQRHTFLTGFVVMPPMVLELVTALMLCAATRCRIPESDARRLLTLTVLIWTTTFALHVPQHQALTTGYDEQVHELLVATNWLRTLLWSLKALLCASLLNRMLHPVTVSEQEHAAELVAARAD